jgi:hypothetical protein
MGLPPATPILVKRGRLGGISEMPLLSFQGYSVGGNMYVGIYTELQHYFLFILLTYLSYFLHLLSLARFC